MVCVSFLTSRDNNGCNESSGFWYGRKRILSVVTFQNLHRLYCWLCKHFWSQKAKMLLISRDLTWLQWYFCNWCIVNGLSAMSLIPYWCHCPSLAVATFQSKFFTSVYYFLCHVSQHLCWHAWTTFESICNGMSTRDFHLVHYIQFIPHKNKYFSCHRSEQVICMVKPCVSVDGVECRYLRNNGLMDWVSHMDHHFLFFV